MKKNSILVLAVIFLLILSPICFSSCAPSTLLLGKWTDGNNVLEFNADGTFKSSITAGGISEDLEGRYVWQEGSNAINFYPDSVDRVMLSYFAIEGGSLIITWTPSASVTETITLYKAVEAK